MSSCAINCQLVPTPYIAVGRGKASQVFPAVQTAITDENDVPIQDEDGTTLVNEQ